MKGTILQPIYLPWMGYFEMIDSRDVFVVFDHVQFERKSWQQRNKIKTANGTTGLTVSVQKSPQDTKISEIKIFYNGGNPLQDHWKTIELAYKKAPYFEKYKAQFEKIYFNKYTLLRDLNVDLIKVICGILGIKTKIILSSNLNLNDEGMGKTEKVINLCATQGISDLYDAKGAEEFLDKTLFEGAGIAIKFQEFLHPEYKQLWGEFVPYLSVLDLLFNEGDNSINIIRSGRRKI